MVESLGLGMIFSLANLIPLYICFKIDKALIILDDSGFEMLSTKQKENDSERTISRELRASTLKVAPRLFHLRLFGKGFWLFTVAHSL